MNKKLDLIDQLHKRINELEAQIKFQEDHYSKEISTGEWSENDLKIFTSHGVSQFVQTLALLKQHKDAVKTYYQLQEELES